jgi:hypothetical protein
MLASVILPLPESDLKTELSFSVNASNTFLPYLVTAIAKLHITAKVGFYGKEGNFSRIKPRCKYGTSGC